MADEQIEPRLGVSAIGDPVRLRLLQSNFEEGSAGTSAGGGSVAGGRPSADAIREERERLFNPRGSRTQSKNKKNQSAPTWTVQFVQGLTGISANIAQGRLGSNNDQTSVR